MGKKSREKGKRGEREAAEFMRQVLGVDAFRGRQFQGGDDSPDVKHSIENVTVEVKRCEALSLYTALDQAQEDAAGSGGGYGVVLHRRNQKDWVLIMTARHFPKVVLHWLRAIGVDTEALGFDGKLF